MLLEISVVPAAPKFKIVKKDSVIKVYLTAQAEDNKANLELIKTLEKLTGKPVRLISGFKSRRKVLEMDLNENEFLKLAEPK
ncbi:MAG: DUF167 domain-containing protein [Candidatus Micrarchaeota archaeon]